MNTEYQKLQEVFGWTLHDFYNCNVNALKAAFIPEGLKMILFNKLQSAYTTIENIYDIMKIYIAILRGINVSGHKMIKMETFREMLEGLDFKNVKTYIQSGNAVFQAKETETGKLEKKIVKKIQEEFGFEVPVMVKKLDEIKAVLKSNPFINKRKEDLSRLHVTFLNGEPAKETVDKIKEGNYGSDEFIFSGKNVYLFCPNGYGNTKLNNNFFENKLKLVATTRNWKTIGELVSMGENIPAK